MYQVRCGHDEFDQTIEYQINWFLDCTETFIHNHRHSFITYCLEGQYIEKLWEMVDEGDHQFGYQFRRHIDGTFDLPKIVPAVLFVTPKLDVTFPVIRCTLTHLNFIRYHPLLNRIVEF
jgi:hypothetical protein